MAQNRLARLRKQHGMTQERLAELSGMRQNRISTIESSPRPPRADFALRILRAVDWLRLEDLVPDGDSIAGEVAALRDLSPPRPQRPREPKGAASRERTDAPR